MKKYTIMLIGGTNTTPKNYPNNRIFFIYNALLIFIPRLKLNSPA